MKILFRDLNPAVCDAVTRAFAGDPDFDVACADVFSVEKADAIISPANSYGCMDGGIDLVYVRRFGWDLQTRLQEAIKGRGGLLPVGEAHVVATNDPNIPLMISAPTMITPGPVPNTNNAYLAFRAALLVGKDFETIICPGLATLTGRMHPEISALQMLQAWRELFVHCPRETNRDLLAEKHPMTMNPPRK